MKKNLIFLLTTIISISCSQNTKTNENNSESNNYIQWSNRDELHDEMIWSGINHFLNIEREKAYVFFENKGG